MKTTKSVVTIPGHEADWRYAKVARISGDQEVFGTPVKDGTLLWQTSVTEDEFHGLVSFPTPSPAALALNIAMRTARAANEARGKVSYSGGMGDHPKSLEKQSISMLFAYFEQCMVSAVFSFQCLEAYANQVISHVLKDPVDLPRRKGTIRLTPDEIELRASTEEKLAVVLPKVLGVPSPKGTKVWAGYKELKGVRDSTVHLKSGDHYVRGRQDRESLYYRFLNTSPLYFPRTAVRTVRHFCSANPERWLLLAEPLLAEEGKGTGT